METPGGPRASLGSLTPRQLAPLVPIAAISWLVVRSIGDNSFLWHVRAGSVQGEVGHVLAADPFSFTRGGEPWRTQSWLVELGYGWLDGRIADLAWVPFMVYIVALITMALAAVAVYSVVREPLGTTLVLVVVAFVSAPFMVPRPVVFSYALLAATVVVLRRPRQLAWILVPLFWVWAGVHASYALGLALVALEAFRIKSWRLFGVGVIAGLTTAFTAHGIGSWEFLITFMESREALDYITEWAVPDFTELFMAPFLLVVAGIVVGALRGQIRPRDLVVVVPFLWLGMTQQRSVFPAIVVLAPYAATALVPRGTRQTSGAGNRFANVVLICVLGLLAIVPFWKDTGLRTDVLPPPEALDALEPGNVFHGERTGGLLIYAEYPERLVYVDDRAELYGVSGFQEFVGVARGEGYDEVFDRYGIGQALVEVDWELASQLRADGWSLQYEDEAWAVYRR